MSCNCDMRTKLVGDGCEHCNPTQALEYAKQTIADQSEENEALTAKLEAAESEARRQIQHAAATLQKLEAAEDALEQEKYAHSGSSAAKFEAWRKIDEQAVQIKALEKDAARYRWLKENKAHNNTHCWHFQNGPIIPGLLTLDAAIDAAMIGDSDGN